MNATSFDYQRRGHVVMVIDVVIIVTIITMDIMVIIIAQILRRLKIMRSMERKKICKRSLPKIQKMTIIDVA